MDENKKFYQKDWFTILTLVIFWPIGLIIMWTNKTFNMAARIIITIFFALCIIISVTDNNNFDTSDEINMPESFTTETAVEVTEASAEKIPEITSEIITTTSSSENNISSTDNIVYIGATGTKYHKQSCSTLKGNGRAVTLDEALSQDREPCKKCKP